MDIPALSLASSQRNLAQSVAIRMLQMNKEQMVQQSQDMIQTLERSAQPGLGGRVDIRV